MDDGDEESCLNRAREEDCPNLERAFAETQTGRASASGTHQSGAPQAPKNSLLKSGERKHTYMEIRSINLCLIQ